MTTVYDGEEGIMVHGRMYRKISFILVMALFLTGIYLDTAADDAFFLCDPAGGTAFCAQPLYTDFNGAGICRQETLNEAGGVENQSAGLHPHLSLIRLDGIVPSQGKMHHFSELVQPFCQTMDGLVAEYLHQSDGKKRS